MLAETNKPQRGLTLTSVMVAVALSGVLAVAAMRLTVNQMKALGTMELIDKGDAIYKFYSNLLHDDKVWWCTLYDGAGTAATTPPNPNKALRDCIFGGTCSSGAGTAGTGMILKGPDCEFKEPTVGGVTKHRFTTEGALDLVTKHGSKVQFQHSPTTFIPEGGKTLKDSVMIASGGGWWEIDLKWKEANNFKEVDLIYTQKFKEDVWRAATGRSTIPDLNYPRVLRVRRSANYIQGGGCGTQAVTKIALHTSNRAVTCGNTLLDLRTSSSITRCPDLGIKGQVIQSTSACSGDRVSVTPTDCGASSSVIWKIGSGVPSPVSNVECALQGRGKMVDWGGCTHSDCVCTGCITTVHNVVANISSSGGLDCSSMQGFPSPSQGKRGVKGRSPTGPSGKHCDGTVTPAAAPDSCPCNDTGSPSYACW